MNLLVFIDSRLPKSRLSTFSIFYFHKDNYMILFWNNIYLPATTKIVLPDNFIAVIFKILHSLLLISRTNFSFIYFSHYLFYPLPSLLSYPWHQQIPALQPQHDKVPEEYTLLFLYPQDFWQALHPDV